MRSATGHLGSSGTLSHVSHSHSTTHILLLLPAIVFLTLLIFHIHLNVNSLSKYEDVVVCVNKTIHKTCVTRPVGVFRMPTRPSPEKIGSRESGGGVRVGQGMSDPSSRRSCPVVTETPHAEFSSLRLTLSDERLCQSPTKYRQEPKIRNKILYDDVDRQKRYLHLLEATKKR